MTAAAAPMPQPNMRASAQKYAAEGCKIIPLHTIKNGVCTCPKGAECHSPGKHPDTTAGFKDGTCDPATVTRRWTQKPDANIGLWCKGLIVVDVDPRNGGEASLEELFSTVADKHGFDTLTAITGGGGRHYIFLAPDDQSYDCKLAPGIDIKSSAGLIVLAPSRHLSGNRYAWEDESIPPATAPQWVLDRILDRIKKPEQPSVRPAFTGKPRDLEEFIAKHGIRTRSPKACRCNFGGNQWDIIGGCPFQPDYEGGSPAIGVTASGATWFGCFCADHPPKKWADFRRLYEPRPAPKATGTGKAALVTLVNAPKPEPQPDAPEGEDAPWPDVPDAPEGHPDPLWTDSTHATRLARIHGADLRYCEDRRMFFVWAGTRWKSDRELHVQRLVETMLLSLYTDVSKTTDDNKRDGMLASIKRSLSQSGVRAIVDASRRHVKPIGAADFDTGVYLLNFRNGTLDLRTGDLREHRREDFISKEIPYDFDASAECPLFHKFLDRIMGGGPDVFLAERNRAERLIAYLQRLFGCACNGVPAKLIVIFWGDGDNGKSTLIEIIRSTLGGDEYSGQMQIESLMANAKDAIGSNAINADIAQLQGCRFVTASEPEKGSKFATARIKHLLGLTKIKARFLKENPFSFVPSHKLFVDCNDKPIISDPDDAIFNRAKLFPFEVKIPRHEIDPTLLQKMQGELPGIMAWLAVGAAEYIRNGLGESPEVAKATEAYRQESDKLRDFFADECVFGATEWVPKTGIWLRYQSWASTNAVRYPLSKAGFEERIQRRGCRDTRKEHNSIRAWEGVRLLSEKEKGDKGTEGDAKPPIDCIRRLS